MPTIFELTPDESEHLQRPINGQGGFQNVLTALNAALDPTTGQLSLDDELLGKTIRYAGYAQGGFQGRLKEAIRRNVADLLN